MLRFLRQLLRFLCLFLAFLCLAAIILQAAYQFLPHQSPPLVWGVTFSEIMAKDLKLDWKANYKAIIEDLKPQSIRLIAYWEDVEPQKGTYDFSDLDWQMQEAGSHNTQIVLTIGQKVPRWPECHYPDWVDPKDDEQPLLDYLTTTVERYRSDPHLQYWQVENEPYLSFGTCQPVNNTLIEKELALVRQLDPNHPILMTDGGEWGNWYEAFKHADVFGTTMYREAYDSQLNESTGFPLTPEYYRAKADFFRLLTGKLNQPVIVSELGLEPWGYKQIYDMSLTEQTSYFTHDEFTSYTQFAEDTHFGTYYFWGAEWWYQAKQNGDSFYWDQAKQLMQTRHE